jgi:uncharacterized protein
MIVCYDTEEAHFVRALANSDYKAIGDADWESGFRKKLVDSDFAVAPNDDPYKALDLTYDRYIYNSGELSVTLIISEACNFRCKYCYEDYDRQVLTDEKLNGVIHFISDFVSEYKCKRVCISWFGGEPTLFKNSTITFMHKLRRQLNPEVNIVAGMTTNAYLLTATEFLDYYKAGIKDYQITVDGFAKTHNNLRTLIDGGETWESIIANLSAINALGKDDAHIILRVNYNEDVLQDIFTFLDFVKTTFGNRFMVHVHPISNMGGTVNDSACSTETHDAAESQLGEYMLTNNIRSDFAELRVQLFGSICYASKPTSFVIDPYGKIRKCTVALKDEVNTVGEIIDETNYYFNTYRLAEWTKTTLDDSECAKCCIYPVCMKRGCTSAMINGAKKCTYNKDAIFIYLRKLADMAYNQIKESDEISNLRGLQ